MSEGLPDRLPVLNYGWTRSTRGEFMLATLAQKIPRFVAEAMDAKP